MIRGLYLSCALMLLALPALAQTAPAAIPQPHKFDMFAVMDQNKDERVTAEEARTNALSYFDKIDVNHDGVVLPDELQIRARDVQALQNGGKPQIDATLMQKLNDRAARQMKAIDVNGDGKVTRDEYATRAVERHKTADANHDGYLTREEFLALRQSIAKSQREARAAAALESNQAQAPAPIMLPRVEPSAGK